MRTKLKMHSAISNFYHLIPILRQCYTQIFIPVGSKKPIEKKSKWKKWPKICRFGTLFSSNFILTLSELKTQYSRYILFKGYMRDHIGRFLISRFVFDSQALKVGGFLKNSKTRKTAFFIHIKINNKKTKPNLKKV